MSTQHARKWQVQEDWHGKTEEKQKVVKKQVVVHKRWVTRGEKFIYSMFSCILIATFTYLVYFSSTLDQLNRNIQSLDADISNQQTLNQNLSYQVKELSQPERIIANAKEHGLELKNSQVKQANEITE
ncbi:cell division protein FtsL [Gracilibacillus ureilyticus]|uniref:Cell division protein FtsL n=1 Tax=Gracilibacillus ureilyticus TaxID=531814 RepID=A0A1H9KX45_9BACI|nr:cell division protein FtsL [Gracilibacillus ureilyticus]SER03764.1 cell division protein FtsL [Gracilibacillus ureilyticus]